jgi:hypothetical protein
MAKIQVGFTVVPLVETVRTRSFFPYGTTGSFWEGPKYRGQVAENKCFRLLCKSYSVALVAFQVSFAGDKSFLLTQEKWKQIYQQQGSPPCGLPGSKFRFAGCKWRLPAAVSSAPASAIAAVTVPASATAATTTTTARPASATAAAEATTTSPAATAASTLAGRPCLVDNNIAAHEIVTVEPLDGALGFLVAIDLDKSEPAWLP